MKIFSLLFLLFFSVSTLFGQDLSESCLSASPTFTAPGPDTYERKVTVNNQSELEEALEDARSGDWIMLEPGDDPNNSPYTGGFVLYDRQDVIISGNPDRPRPVIDGRLASGVNSSEGLRVNKGRNVRVSYLEFRRHRNAELYAGKYYSGQEYEQSFNITFTHNVFFKTGQAGIKMGGVSGGYIAYNVVHDTGLKEGKFGEGIYLGDGNRLENNTHDIVIEKNEIYNTVSEGIDIKSGSYNIDIIGNYVHDVNVKSQGAITVWQNKDFEGDDTPINPNIKVIGNRIHDVTTRKDDGGGIVMACPGRIESNVIWNVADHGIQANSLFGNTTGTLFVISNTVWNPGENHDPISMNNTTNRDGSPGKATVRYNVSNDDFRSDTYRDNNPEVIYENNRTISADELVGPLNGLALAFPCNDVFRGAGTGFIPTVGASIVDVAEGGASLDASLTERVAPFTLGAWQVAGEQDDSRIVTTTDWNYRAFANRQSNFTATFEATPTGTAVNGLVTLSPDVPDAYADNAVLIRFNEDNLIDVRNGSNYDASAQISYTPNTKYRFRVVVNANRHTYTAYVQLEGGDEVLLGKDIDFRTEQADATELGYWGYLHNNQAALILENLVINSDSSEDTSEPELREGNVVIRAKGSVGSEQLSLLIDGKVEKSWTVTTQAVNYVYEGYSGGSVALSFDNDLVNEAGDRNLAINYVDVCGERQEAEGASNSASVGCSSTFSGFVWLWCNASLDFGNVGCNTSARTASAVSKTPELNQEWSERFKTYPNPAAEQLTVEGGEDYQVALYDLTGRAVMRHDHLKGKAALDVSHLRPGVYVLKMSDGLHPQLRQRIVVE